MSTTLVNLYILLSILPWIVSSIVFVLESNVETHDFELFAIILAKTWNHVLPYLESTVLISDPIDSFYSIFSLVWTNEVLKFYLDLNWNKQLNRPNIMLIIIHPYRASLVPQPQLTNIAR